MTAPTWGLLDTSVVIAIDEVQPALLPEQPSISALTLAELTAGPHATDNPMERARRQALLQRIEASLDALPFGAGAARAFGPIYAATLAVGRRPRGARAVDLLIAAVALGNDLPLVTRNPADVEHLQAIGLVLHAV